MNTVSALTRRTTICTRKLASGSTQSHLLISCIPWSGLSCGEARAIALSPLSTFARFESNRRPPFVCASWWSSTTTNNMSSKAASDAAADAALRAMADPLDGIDEAIVNEDLVPTAPWGLVVYRTAYGDDAAWRRILDALEASTVESLALHGRSNLLGRHRLVHFEDPATLDGAAPDDVRARFTQWAAGELRRNWCPDKPAPNQERARRADTDGPGYFLGTRYNYCLQVDDICLESLEHMASPVVKLVRKAWQESRKKQVPTDRSGGEADEEYDEQGDVGWMYLPVSDYVECCNQLHDAEFWDDGYYVRPPFTFLERSHTRAPGFWRRQQSKA